MLLPAICGYVVVLLSADVVAAKPWVVSDDWGKLWTDTSLAFTRANGTARHPDRVSKLFEDAVSASALPHIRLHELRHAHSAIALGASMHPKVVSDLPQPQHRRFHPGRLLTLSPCPCPGRRRENCGPGFSRRVIPPKRPSRAGSFSISKQETPPIAGLSEVRLARLERATLGFVMLLRL